jgi:hypothetical protein
MQQQQQKIYLKDNWNAKNAVIVINYHLKIKAFAKPPIPLSYFCNLTKATEKVEK